MKPNTIVDVYKKTKEVFRDGFPEQVIFNFNRATSTIEDVISTLKTENILFNGNFATGPSTRQRIESMIQGGIPTLRGRFEDMLVSIDDAITRADEEDILIYGATFLNNMNGYDVIHSYNPELAKERTAYIPHGDNAPFIDTVVRLFRGSIPDKHIRWLRDLPYAYLFTDMEGRSSWDGGTVLLISSTGRFGFEDDPSTLIVSPAKTCWSTGPNAISPASWIPFLLFPEKITKKYVREYDIYGYRGSNGGGVCPGVNIGRLTVPPQGWTGGQGEECVAYSLGKDLKQYTTSRLRHANTSIR